MLIHDLHRTTLEDGQFEFTAGEGHEFNIDMDETKTKVDSNLNLDEENICIDKEYDLENREEAIMNLEVNHYLTQISFKE
jgi:hypothetical protein